MIPVIDQPISRPRRGAAGSCRYRLDHPLALWLRRHRMRVATFAQLVDASPAAVRAWLRGRVPNRRHMAKIYVVTGGEIGPAAFYRMPRRHRW
jgi:hypothetical protein